MRYAELQTALREEEWLEKHLNQVVREGRKSGWLEATGYTGRFSPKANPLLRCKTEAEGE